MPCLDLICSRRALSTRATRGLSRFVAIGALVWGSAAGGHARPADGADLPTPGAALVAPAGSARDLRFSELFKTPVGRRGLEPTDQVRAADGQRVRMTGYMVAEERPQPGRFLLTARPVALLGHADGEPDDLPAATVTVVLPADERTVVPPYTRGLLRVSGVLTLGPRLEADGRRSWVQLHLDAAP